MKWSHIAHARGPLERAAGRAAVEGGGAHTGGCAGRKIYSSASGPAPSSLAGLNPALRPGLSPPHQHHEPAIATHAPAKGLAVASISGRLSPADLRPQLRMGRLLSSPCSSRPGPCDITPKGPESPPPRFAATAFAPLITYLLFRQRAAQTQRAPLPLPLHAPALAFAPASPPPA